MKMNGQLLWMPPPWPLSQQHSTAKNVHLEDQGPVARSLVSANRWLRGIKMNRFPWYLTLASTNHASSNPGQVSKL